jgi:hypothetical protein
MRNDKKILYLTLKKPQFEVTNSGEKKKEYRRRSDWILSRLINKNYDLVKFTNGYGKNKPSFYCEFISWKYTNKNTFNYSNGLIVNVADGDIEIELGKVIQKIN